jgi:hypothetical protein
VNKKISEDQLIQNFKAMAEFSLPNETVARDLADLRRLVQDQPFDFGKSRMKRGMVKGLKYAAAAMMVVTAFVCWQLLPSSELSAAELLTRVSKNLKNFPRVKSTTENYLPGQTEPTRIDISYIDMARKQVFAVYEEKYIHRMDYEKMLWSVYRPEDNTLIVQPLAGEWMGPEIQLTEYIEKLKTEGLEVQKTETTENGAAFTVIEYDEILNNISSELDRFMSKMRMDGKPVKTIRTKLVIHKKDWFLSRTEIGYYDPRDNLILRKKITDEPIDYVPADMRELGMPADVKVINKVPDEEVRHVREIIDQKRQAFLSRYLAIKLENIIRDGNEELMEAMVIYADVRKLRVDVFGKNYPSYGQIPEAVSGLVKNSHDLLQAYLPNNEELHLRSVRIYDGLRQHKLDYHEKQYLLRIPQRRPDGDEFGDDDIDDFGWRKLWWLDNPEWMYEDEFSQQNGLIGMELAVQSDLGRLPKRLVLYVDPTKDYLYRRYIEQELVDAPWQIDKSWIDQVKDKTRLTERVRIYDVVEYGQTSEGQWYPKVFTIKGYDNYLREKLFQKDFSRICRIYLLEENPDFSEDLFDVSKFDDVDMIKKE